MFAPSVYQICTHIFPQDKTVYKAHREAMKKGNVVVNCSLLEAVTVLDKQHTDFSLFCNLTDLLLSQDDAVGASAADEVPKQVTKDTSAHKSAEFSTLY